MSSHAVTFLKGHGTQNDFVLLPDLDGHLDLDAATVASICHRRAGVGADGVLRVVRTEAAGPDDSLPAGSDGARFFMDYRNSDGSVAEMCGNGLRVFARYLVDDGLEAPGDFAVATRAGVRHVSVPARQSDGAAPDVTVDLGRFRVVSEGRVTVSIGDDAWSACHVDMGNPHAVAFVDDLADAGDLRTAPRVTPAEEYPHGVNVELVVQRGPQHVAMRVHERGVGETQSCGTGAGAAAVAAALRADGSVGDGSWRVDVPGGTVRVGLAADGQVRLTGPAEIVAEGVLGADLAPRRHRRGR